MTTDNAAVPTPLAVINTAYRLPPGHRTALDTTHSPNDSTPLHPTRSLQINPPSLLGVLAASYQALGIVDLLQRGWRMLVWYSHSEHGVLGMQ